MIDFVNLALLLEVVEWWHINFEYMKQLTKILVIVVVLSLAVIWYTRDSRRPNSPVVGNVATLLPRRR